MAGHVWAYARVSTRDQNPQLQLDALEASGYDTLVQEKESGKRGVLRPAWQELLPLPQPGDTLKFWKSDRWGRSAADVLATVNELRDRGVRVVSLTENFDLATKEGRLMFGVLALAAEYELELRAERQADGIAAARRRQAEGRMLPGKKHIGRPPATGPAELAALRDLIAGGKSVTEAARILKIGRSTAYAALAALWDKLPMIKTLIFIALNRDLQGDPVYIRCARCGTISDAPTRTLSVTTYRPGRAPEHVTTLPEWTCPACDRAGPLEVGEQCRYTWKVPHDLATVTCPRCETRQPATRLSD